MNKPLYPYETIEGEVKLELTKQPKLLIQDFAETLGREAVREGTREIDLWMANNKKWESLQLGLKIETTSREIEKLQRSGINPSVAVVASCGKTNIRQARLAQRSPLSLSCWDCELELDRRSFSGKVELKGIIAGDANKSPCRFLAASEPWVLLLDESLSLPPSGSLPVLWVDFDDPEYPHLNRHLNEPTYVDLQQEKPTVYLNKKFENLPDLFVESPRPTGVRMALVELERMSIAKSVWLALFQASVTGITKTDEDEAEWPSVGWQRDVLKKILPKIYLGIDIESALERALEDKSTADRICLLESQALATISKEILREGRSTRKALRVLEHSENGGQE